MENEPSGTDSEKETQFYTTFSLPPLSDEDVLPLYALYKRVSGGQTLEPFETLLKAHPEAAEPRYENERAA